MRNLYEEFRHFEGQPVVIFTDDEKRHRGLVVNVCDWAVRIIDQRGNLMLIEYPHITAVEEPQMMFRHFRFGDDNDCDCDGYGDDYHGRC